jgi:hypothetical protein
MNERSGWTILAIGAALCLIGWLLFAMAAHLFGIRLGEVLFLCA